MDPPTDIKRQSNVLPDPADSSKRVQILEGARSAFLTRGFDATSMIDIARSAGVSKGTLYVHFKNKEKLFEEMCTWIFQEQIEVAFRFDSNDRDIQAALIHAGIDLATFVCQPEIVSLTRTVIAIADRMPAIGSALYKAGPARAIMLLSTYLNDQVTAGILNVDNCDLAAAQLIDACQSNLFKPMIFNFSKPPTHKTIHNTVRTAVAVFLAAYRLR